MVGISKSFHQPFWPRKLSNKNLENYSELLYALLQGSPHLRANYNTIQYKYTLKIFPHLRVPWHSVPGYTSTRTCTNYSDGYRIMCPKWPQLRSPTISNMYKKSQFRPPQLYQRFDGGALPPKGRVLCHFIGFRDNNLHRPILLFAFASSMHSDQRYSTTQACLVATQVWRKALYNDES